MRPARLVVCVCLCLAVLPTLSAVAQAEGTAAITSPASDAILSGIVVIAGTASHPQFQRYELAFGYDPNLTNTWFSIQEPVTLPVTDEVLGRWNTSGISDGVYVLRLRVYASEQSVVEAFVPGVRVQNASPTPTATSTAEVVTPTPEPTLPSGPTPTAALITVPSASAPRPTAGPAGGGSELLRAAAELTNSALQEAFFSGVRLTLVVFGLLGVYAGLRALWESRLRR
jgi:hypothetical protein